MSYPYELKDISCFIKLVNAGSLAQASRTYAIPKSTLGYHLRRLEDALGVQLFKRKLGGLELTEAGREYLSYATMIFDACEAAANAAQRAHSGISGDVKIIGSSEFGTSILGAAALFLLRAHPQLSFTLTAYPKAELLAGEIDFDCIIYVGTPPDSSLLRRKLGDFSSGLYASPTFIDRNGTPENPQALTEFDGVIYHRNENPELWALTNNSTSVVATCRPRFNVDEYWMAKYFAVESAAIAYLPDFFTHYEIQSGALIKVLPAWSSETSSINILYPKQRHKNPKVMKVVDAICVSFDHFIRTPAYSVVSQHSVRPSRRDLAAQR